MTRQFRAITTCHKQGWDKYGRNMVDAYLRHWPSEVPLTFYTEDTVPRTPGIELRSLPSWLFEFVAKHKPNRKACGMNTNAPDRGQYNYRFDAVRFAYKTGAVIDAVERADCDILIWVDADTVTHSPVSLTFLRELAPNMDQVISWLYRVGKYPECGFYMLNLRNPLTAHLIREWKDLYLSGRLFHLPEWHDSYVLEQLVKTLKCPAHSISGAGESTHHPFINGPLGAVMDHMKGVRKDAGRSSTRDLKVMRDEKYWKRT